MDVDPANAERARLDELMADQRAFLERFGALDEDVYADGAIPERYEELMGRSISALTRWRRASATTSRGRWRPGRTRHSWSRRSASV